ncbi:unnamed protein product [Phytophthora fragariaefolia]|uniref:Unnamed protein product n=1 Tax=Phytophthora fragariaefolia TaxID=1490495 RepID=A0A9W6XYL4_9STRA|nr:unnamed protein product [Phytophthora fragariaefolia]
MHAPRFILGFTVLTTVVANSLAAIVGQSSLQPILFAATHTRDEGWMVGTGKGVYTYKFDSSDGSLIPLGITQSYPGTQTGYVSALRMRPNGTLELLNTLESHGGNPTHISLNPSEEVVVVSNYDGSLSMFPLNDDGSLANESFHQDFPIGSKVVMDQQATGHIHSSIWLPNSNHVVAANLGSDELLQYELETTKKTLKSIATIKRPPGSGPRHMAIHPNAAFAYVVDEITNIVGVYAIDKKSGVLSSAALQNISTLPAGFTNTSTAADVHVSSNGKFLYASNRGHNSIAIFAVDKKKGSLTSVGWEGSRGKTPKSFVAYEDWMVVANQDSDTMHVFGIDADTGLLSCTGNSYDVGTPERVFDIWSYENLVHSDNADI